MAEAYVFGNDLPYGGDGDCLRGNSSDWYVVQLKSIDHVLWLDRKQQAKPEDDKAQHDDGSGASR